MGSHLQEPKKAVCHCMSRMCMFMTTQRIQTPDCSRVSYLWPGSIFQWKWKDICWHDELVICLEIRKDRCDEMLQCFGTPTCCELPGISRHYIALTSSENHLRLIEIDDDGMKMMDHGWMDDYHWTIDYHGHCVRIRWVLFSQCTVYAITLQFWAWN